MAKEKIELTLQDESGQEYVAYPFVESEDVTLSNGMDIETMIAQDVSMPIVTHEETSFKVGVGDSDISNSIVDSSVANMIIKGQTYQNILPDPTLRNSMTNGKTMQKLNEGYDSVNTVDGVCKSAILSGNTLVNVIDEISFPSSANHYFYVDLKQYEINKDYLFMIFNAPQEIIEVYFGNGASTIVWRGYTSDFVRNGSTISLKVTCPSNYDGSTILPHIRYGGASLSLDVLKQIKVMLIPYQQGMENWDIPYFEGMQSVKMPVLTTTGKNLFELPQSDKMLKGSTGKYIKLNLKPNTNYTYNSILDKKGNISEFDFYGWISNDINSNFTGYEVFHWKLNKTFSKTFNTGNDEWYFHVYGEQKGDDYRNYLINFQLELGSTATSYESHKSNILSCQLAPLNQSMFEQGTFAESTPPNTQSYEQIKLGSEHLYTTRIRTKGTYKVVQGATYEVQLNDGYGIFICYCKNGLYSAKDKGWIDETNFTFTVPNDCDEMFFALRKTDNSAITPSDYPLIGLKIHQEVVLRSLPNGVKDVLNLNTGEYVQRIGEITFNGSETWYESAAVAPNHYCAFARVQGSKNALSYNIVCNSLPARNILSTTIDYEGCMFNEWSSGDKANVVVKIANSKLSSTSVEGIKAYLQSNPLTVQYELATPIIKTVDLSSSGNWEKIVLDGSEDWRGETIKNGMRSAYILPRTQQLAGGGIFSDKLKGTTQGDEVGIRNSRNNGIYLQISDDGTTIKQWVTANAPLTAWYQTQTHQDSTNVKEMLSFSNGHVQLSSAEGSLIPSLSYEVPTSNSYQLDLAKTNTKYTMKSSSASGNFTIDGTQYNFNTNGTFTTPSTMNNKLMIANGTVTDLMFIEGDVTSKTIPYFKGIKSAFEDEDKIEVLSVGKNVFDYSEHPITLEKLAYNNGVLAVWIGYIGVKTYVPVKENTTYTYSNDINIGIYYGLVFYDKNKNVISYVNKGENNTWIPSTFTTPKNCAYIRFSMQTQTIPTWIQIEESSTQTSYEPYKSNSTKIPLLSPLRGLPNGVRDEIVLDRVNHKAKIIQRVGEDLTQLATPIITEIDLEGFPYIYKDGHIFLNTDIAPVSEITYSINQQQQIEASNEDLMRHEKKITNLHKLIATYVNVEYESTLLALNLELK